MKILKSEYEKALLEIEMKQKIIDKYKDQFKCQHLKTKHVCEYNTFPYGEDFEYDLCEECGETINFKVM